MEILLPLFISAFIYLLTFYLLTSYLKRKVNRTWLIILAIIFSLFFVVGTLIGLSIGMNLGGNYYGDFVFNGLRGYEAVGNIGAIIGGFLGVGCGSLLVLFIVGFKGNGKRK